MSDQEAGRRLFGAACAQLRTLVETHCASLPSVERAAMELTAWLYLAEWAAAEASALHKRDRLDAVRKAQEKADER